MGCCGYTINIVVDNIQFVMTIIIIILSVLKNHGQKNLGEKKITNILKPVMEKYMCKYNTSQIHYYKVLVFVLSKSMTMAKTLAPN